MLGKGLVCLFFRCFLLHSGKTKLFIFCVHPKCENAEFVERVFNVDHDDVDYLGGLLKGAIRFIPSCSVNSVFMQIYGCLLYKEYVDIIL